MTWTQENFVIATALLPTVDYWLDDFGTLLMSNESPCL